MPIEYFSCDLPTLRDVLVIVTEFDDGWGVRNGEGYVITTQPKPFLHVVRVRRTQSVKDADPEVAAVLDIASYVRAWCVDKVSELLSQRHEPQLVSVPWPPQVTLAPARLPLHARRWSAQDQEAVLGRCAKETGSDELRTAVKRVLRLPRLQVEVQGIDPARPEGDS